MSFFATISATFSGVMKMFSMLGKRAKRKRIDEDEEIHNTYTSKRDALLDSLRKK